jgi:hypothetical protein
MPSFAGTLSRSGCISDDGARVSIEFVGISPSAANASTVNWSKRMMSSASRSTFIIGAALVLALTGCQKSDPTAGTSNGVPAERVANATPIPQFPKGDPSVPDAATVFAAQDAVEKARLMQETTALQDKPAPQEPMTEAEESKAMPLPAQANDHSTTALDKNKGG